jgi:ureidoglycolate dehydrogenase (NAD+)
MDAQLAQRDVVAEARTHVCDALIQTSLRGVDSHGINLFPHYCRAVDSGRINAAPNMKLVREAPASAVLDADHGFGHHAGARAMAIAADKAGANGVGAVAVRNSTHFAAAAYFGLQAADRGLIGMAFTNADSLVRAHGSSRSYFGTNPICVTAPLAKEGPLCLDMATSVVSFNRIKNHRAVDKPIDPAWASDNAGNPTADPHQAVSLSPIGTYKGFGLGMIVEVLCGLLASGPYAHELIPMYEQLSARRSISHFFLAIDPSKMLGLDEFRVRLQAMVDHIRKLPPLKDGDVVQVPGDPEKRSAVLRRREGIPVEDEKLREFLALSQDFDGALKS